MSVKTHISSIFFGNYFYGVCAVGLSVEASLQQRFPLLPLPYYLLIAGATIWFYTKAYITEQTVASGNPRTDWYIRNKVPVQWSQRLLLLLMGVSAVYLLATHEMYPLSLLQYLLAFVFPLASYLYYGVSYQGLGHFNLRKIGWIKPFIIGFSWAGLCTVYPILFYRLTHPQPIPLTLISVLLFIKNFMFVSVLCIMFDIKDYAMDYNRRLKTFVVKTGLRKTIFYIIIPLCLAGLGSFLLYGSTHRFSGMKITLNTIPFLLTIAMAYSLHRRKGILYYLILIDGLMLVKAVCGIVAMRWF